MADSHLDPDARDNAGGARLLGAGPTDELLGRSAHILPVGPERPETPLTAFVTSGYAPACAGEDQDADRTAAALVEHLYEQAVR